MGGIISRWKWETKQELSDLCYPQDAVAITNYIRRHRDNIDELLPWDSFSQTALHFAVNKGWMQVVKALVEAGADINVFDANKNTILPCYVPFGRQPRVLHTPLMHAARNRCDLDIAQYLLEHGADPFMKCPNTGRSAISLAVEDCNVDLILLLIEKYDVDPTKVLDMTRVCHSNKTECLQDTAEFIELLLEKGAQMDLHYMHVAVRRGWLNLVEVFVKAGSDVNVFDTDSCYRPYKECVKCFNPAHRKSVSQSCSRSDQPFDSGLETRIRYTPLMIAAMDPHLFDIAQYLLAHGADPHLRCPNTGESAVSVAIKHSNVDLVQLLIEKYNVEFDSSKILTMTCELLFESVNFGHEHDITEYIKLLLEKGAQIHSEFINLAIRLRWNAGVKFIVRAGVDINLFHEEDHIMYTPLMRAARSPDLFGIAEYLLAHGADPHLKCPNTGKSALSMAIAHCNTALIRLLIQKYNAEFDSTNVLIDICEKLRSPRRKINGYQTRECIKLLLKKGAQMGSHYKTVIEQLLPTPNISQDDLHSYFREGFNINILCKYYTERRNKFCANHIRWFLRHGLDTNAHFIEICFKKALKTQNNEIVTLLLHAGVDRFVITRWVKRRRFPGLPKLRECNELAYNEYQEDDLVEFSDVSLHIYPEVKTLSVDEIDRQYNSLVRLVSRPFTLQGLCRQCLRQSLCEPSPTVVMTLPIPRALKRYILCHDL